MACLSENFVYAIGRLQFTSVDWLSLEALALAREAEHNLHSNKSQACRIEESV